MHDAPANARSVTGQARPDQPAPWRALIIDDEAAVRQGLAGLLTHGLGTRVDVRSASDLAGARDAFRAHRPHIVLLDLDLAGEDGLQLMPEMGGSHVVAVTSHTDASTRHRLRLAGVEAMHGKSESGAALVRWIKRTLSHPQLKGDEAPGEAVGLSVVLPDRGA